MRKEKDAKQKNKKYKIKNYANYNLYNVICRLAHFERCNPFKIDFENNYEKNKNKNN